MLAIVIFRGQSWRNLRGAGPPFLPPLPMHFNILAELLLSAEHGEKKNTIPLTSMQIHIHCMLTVTNLQLGVLKPWVVFLSTQQINRYVNLEE